MRKEGDRYDQTYLSRKLYGKTIHRDYLAHCLRWGFSERFITADETRILDLGCGPEAPLARSLMGGGTVRGRVPGYYLGVDLSPIKPMVNSKRAEYWGEFDFITRADELPGGFDLVTSFEVIEHMEPADGLRLLKIGRDQMTPDGYFLLSTPCFNGRAARNHVHEYEIEELAEFVDAADLEVEARYGTFMSTPTLRRVAEPEVRKIADALSEYLSYEVIANVFACMYPDHARNNMWVLRHPEAIS